MTQSNMRTRQLPKDCILHKHANSVGKKGASEDMQQNVLTIKQSFHIFSVCFYHLRKLGSEFLKPPIVC